MLRNALIGGPHLQPVLFASITLLESAAAEEKLRNAGRRRGGAEEQRAGRWSQTSGQTLKPSQRKHFFWNSEARWKHKPQKIPGMFDDRILGNNVSAEVGGRGAMNWNQRS